MKSRKYLLFLVLLTVLPTSLASVVKAQSLPPVEISYQDVFGEQGGLQLPPRWEYQPLVQSSADMFVDSRIVDARLLWQDSIDQEFEGSGWFRQTIRIDSALINVPLGLSIKHFGTAEILVDGELAASFGRRVDAGNLEPSLTNDIGVITFRDSLEHTLTVKYQNHDHAALHSVQYNAGFDLTFGDAEKLIAGKQSLVRIATGAQSGMTALFLMFGLLHVFMFIFYPRRKENLVFAFVAFTIAMVLFNNFHEAFFFDNAPQLVLVRRIWAPLSMSVVFSFLVFLYLAFQISVPRYFYWLLVLGVIMATWGWIDPRLGWARPAGGRTYAYAYALVIQVIILSVATRGIIRKLPGAKIVGVGVIAMVSAFAYPIMVTLGFIQAFDDLLLFSNFVILGLFLSISFYLSRRFAQTSISLENKLEEVTRLSEVKIDDEKRIRQQEIERNLMEASYEQKLRELEEARELQLSMLPKTLPEHTAFELATYMQTATEVGGDYYDFHLDTDGTLTIAVGDATGHGMKAGMMVTATKSLFNSMARNNNLLGIFDQATRALKLMNLHKIYMALTLCRLAEGKLTIASAGMPPTLIFRASSSTVDVVTIKGMPLGSFVNFPYEQRVHELQPGDTVLFMSDGLPELFSESGEMFGYTEVVDAFRRIASQPSEQIISELVTVCRNWSGSRSQDDDITFVVLKIPHAIADRDSNSNVLTA